MKKIILASVLFANLSGSVYASYNPGSNPILPDEDDLNIFKEITKPPLTATTRPTAPYSYARGNNTAPLVFTEGDCDSYVRKFCEQMVGKDKLDEIYKKYRTGAVFMDDKFFLYTYLLNGDKKPLLNPDGTIMSYSQLG